MKRSPPSRRTECNPWDARPREPQTAPEGRRNARPRVALDSFRCPSGAIRGDDSNHGLRDGRLRRRVASPVATARRPFGAKGGDRGWPRLDVCVLMGCQRHRRVGFSTERPVASFRSLRELRASATGVCDACMETLRALTLPTRGGILAFRGDLRGGPSLPPPNPARSVFFPSDSRRIEPKNGELRR